MSLADCFTKIGKALSGNDKAAIEALVADGMSETDAVNTHLSQLDGDVQSVLDEVEAAGGEVQSNQDVFNQFTFDFTDTSPAKVQKQAAFVGRETIKTVDLGFDSLNTIQKIASATRSLSKSAQEKLWVIALDDNYKPLAILNHSMGLRAEASADIGIMAGWATGVPGAKKIMLSHNHPSGSSRLSRADKYIANTITDLLDGSGVDSLGIIAVTPDSYSALSDGVESDGDLLEAETTNKVDLEERTLELDPNAEGNQVESPGEALAAVKEYANGETGILLLNNQHFPIGFLPLTYGTQLRGGALPDILNALEQTNSSAVILAVDEFGAAEANVANMVTAAMMKVLDAIDKGGASVASRGQDLTTSNTFNQGVRGYYDPANTAIRLTEAANLSTFLHEFAHFMYETEIVDDSGMLEGINKWLTRDAVDVTEEAQTHTEVSLSADDTLTYINEGTTGDTGKDEAIRRAAHERFARAFETYLMEGKAPSVELRSVFSTIARWLSDVYRFISGDLNVNLDPEMRQVFDRLLATDEQVTAAEARSGLTPLFTDAERDGMNDEQWEAYQAKINKAKDKQNETLRDKLIEQITRHKQAWWDRQKQDMIDQETENARQERVYRAREILTAPPKSEDSKVQAQKVQAQKDVKELEKALKRLKIDNDTVGKYIAKAGGLDRESMSGEGVDPSHFKEKGKVFGKPLFPREGGMTADEIAELLNEIKFSAEDLTANDAMEVIFELLDDDVRYIDSTIEAEIAGIENDIAEIEGQAHQVDVKLDHATLRSMVGATVTDKRGVESVRLPQKLNKMTSKQGLHPDQVALLLDYDSGSELLSDLIDAPSLKELAATRAEARMVEEHGDIMNDGTIQQEADEAVRNEERGEVLLTEMKQLNKKPRRAAPKLDKKQIKDMAVERIGKLSFREIQPQKYRNAELKAAQESVRLLAEGDRDGAAAAKTRQVVNYYLERAATDAKRKTESIVEFTARYKKKSVQVAIKKAGGGYWDQIESILNRFEFRKSATLKSVENINAWAAERIKDDGDGLTLDGAVLKDGFVAHWKDVPFADLQGVHESLKNIEHVARYAYQMQVNGEKVEFERLETQWVDHISEQNSRFDTKGSRSRIDDSRKATLNENVRRWASQMSKIPYISSWLDGGDRAGLSSDILVTPFTLALDHKMALLDEIVTPVMEEMRGRTRADRARHKQKLWIPEIDDTLEGHQILSVALNTGNQGNLRKMLRGEGWAKTDEEVSIDNPKLQAVLSHMTAEDWGTVQKIWDQMELLYPMLAEVHEKTTGIRPPQVEATPVVTSHGTFRGGYYPIKYSTKRGHQAEKNAERDAEVSDTLFGNQGSIQAQVNTGTTNERTGYFAPIRLSLEVVPDHFNEVIHYITHHEVIRQTNKLIRSPKVEDAITGVLGEAEYKQIMPWLKDVAHDGRIQPTKTFIDEAFMQLRMGATLGMMGIKASTGIMQVYGLFTTAAELGVGPTLGGVYTTIGQSWYMKKLRSLLGSTEDMQVGWDFAIEKSHTMAHRMRNMDREMKSALDNLRGKKGALPWVQEASMKHIMLIQVYFVDLPTWHAAYDKELSETGDEARAIKRADWSVENLHGSGATKDMAAIVRNQSKIHTTFTMFMTYFSAMGNFGRDIYKGGRSGVYAPTSVAAKFMFLYTIPVFMEMLMRGQLNEPEDEDDRLARFLTANALYPFTSIPFARDLAGGVIGDYQYNISPVASILEQGVGGISSILDRSMTEDEFTKGSIKGVTKLAGASLGIPGVNQIWATGEHLYDVMEEGEELTLRELAFGPKREK